MVQTNYLTRERTGVLATCDVIKVSVTSDGLWMATLEEREDGKSTVERRLKFWEFDDAKQRCREWGLVGEWECWVWKMGEWATLNAVML